MSWTEFTLSTFNVVSLFAPLVNLLFLLTGCVDDCRAALILQSQDGSPETLWHCFNGAVGIKAGN